MTTLSKLARAVHAHAPMRRSVESLAPCLAASLLLAGCPLAVSDDYQIAAEAGPQGGTIATPEQAAPGGGGGGAPPTLPTSPTGSDASPAPTLGPEAEKHDPVPADRQEPRCESVCNAGCSGDVCSIDCSAQEHCDGAELRCPPGRRCTVVCGPRSCRAATIRCEDTECDIQCSGGEACVEARIRCGDRPCTVTCNGNGACEDATLDCGEGDCTTSGIEAGECDDDGDCDD